MNNDLIHRSAALAVLEELKNHVASPDPVGEVADAIETMRKVQAVDAEPVQNGRWGKYGKTRRKIVCSLCDCPAPFKKQKTDYHIRKQKPGYLIRWESNYCPNCGAKMDAEVE